MSAWTRRRLLTSTATALLAAGPAVTTAPPARATALPAAGPAVTTRPPARATAATARPGDVVVADALRALPVETDVPWQRVINKQGKLSPRGSHDRCEPDRQRGLLEAEGVAFDAEARVDFKRFGWEGPPGALP